MDKRYQVFVSSTYRDLEKERAVVIATLMDQNCIPAGMENFPAMDEEAFSYIKRVIDLCDYYILIIGNRYGSRSPDGLSYTEKEFDYANQKGIPILVFIHENPGTIASAYSDQTPEDRESTFKFRAKASQGRIVRYWNNPDELAGRVATSLGRTIQDFPGIGWVRGDRVVDPKPILDEANQLRADNSRLKARLDQIERSDARHSPEEEARRIATALSTIAQELLQAAAPSQEFIQKTFGEQSRINIGENAFCHIGEQSRINIGENVFCYIVGRRQMAEWSEVFEELRSSRLTEPVDSTGDRVVLTAKGYRVADAIRLAGNKVDGAAPVLPGS